MEGTARWYHLLAGGRLVRGSDHLPAEVLTSWRVDRSEPGWRDQAWSLLVEALAGGASSSRTRRLAAAWSLDEADAIRYADAVGCAIWAWRGEPGWSATPAVPGEQVVASGTTPLEAMAALCRALGYVPKPTWRVTFRAQLATVRRSRRPGRYA